ncbi:MAG: hypothetical protein AVDCRST_MAG35-1250 [uncultured Quadrisphaera sp.]|uniref:Uncharacterized protein n=1 Tax=uncultured Quadrisphaera sp. TaxID=904978 RepID=A0A6J4P8L7_9ACTN|nr:MAG: hypothetical protein AVDCRST_MAG35-1250 [uncultured Quadrisphaera sp.]
MLVGARPPSPTACWDSPSSAPVAARRQHRRRTSSTESMLVRVGPLRVTLEHRAG